MRKRVSYTIEQIRSKLSDVYGPEFEQQENAGMYYGQLLRDIAMHDLRQQEDRKRRDERTTYWDQRRNRTKKEKEDRIKTHRFERESQAIQYHLEDEARARRRVREWASQREGYANADRDRPESWRRLNLDRLTDHQNKDYERQQRRLQRRSQRYQSYRLSDDARRLARQQAPINRQIKHEAEDDQFRQQKTDFWNKWRLLDARVFNSYTREWDDYWSSFDDSWEEFTHERERTNQQFWDDREIRLPQEEADRTQYRETARHLREERYGIEDEERRITRENFWNDWREKKGVDDLNRQQKWNDYWTNRPLRQREADAQRQSNREEYWQDQENAYQGRVEARRETREVRKELTLERFRLENEERELERTDFWRRRDGRHHSADTHRNRRWSAYWRQRDEQFDRATADRQEANKLFWDVLSGHYDEQDTLRKRIRDTARCERKDKHRDENLARALEREQYRDFRDEKNQEADNRRRQAWDRYEENRGPRQQRREAARRARNDNYWETRRQNHAQGADARVMERERNRNALADSFNQRKIANTDKWRDFRANRNERYLENKNRLIEARDNFWEGLKNERATENIQAASREAHWRERGFIHYARLAHVIHGITRYGTRPFQTGFYRSMELIEDAVRFIGRKLGTGFYITREKFEAIGRQLSYAISYSARAIFYCLQDGLRPVWRAWTYLFRVGYEGLEYVAHRVWQATTYLANKSLKYAQKIAIPFWRGTVFLSRLLKECLQTISRAIYRSITFVALVARHAFEDLFRALVRRVYSVYYYSLQGLREFAARSWQLTTYVGNFSLDYGGRLVIPIWRGFGFIAFHAKEALQTIRRYLYRGSLFVGAAILYALQDFSSYLAYNVSYLFHHGLYRLQSVAMPIWRATTYLTNLYWQGTERISVPVYRGLYYVAHHVKEALQTMGRAIYRVYDARILLNALEDIFRPVAQGVEVGIHYLAEGLTTALTVPWKATLYLVSLTAQYGERTLLETGRAISYVGNKMKDNLFVSRRYLARQLSSSAEAIRNALQDIFRPIRRRLGVEMQKFQEATTDKAISAFRKTESVVLKAAEMLSGPAATLAHNIGFFAHSSKDKAVNLGVKGERAVNRAGTQLKQSAETAIAYVASPLTFLGKHAKESAETVGRKVYRGVSDLNPTAAFWRHVETKALFFNNSEEYIDLPIERGGHDRYGIDHDPNLVFNEPILA